MADSLVNHLSPDARPHDLLGLDGWCPGFRTDVTLPYFPSADGRWYSYHFWGYSLAVIPVKLALRAVGADELRAFQVSNALMLIAALSCVLFLPPWDPVWRTLLALLSLVGPAFWFVQWPHPEIYSYALVTMALVCMTRGAWTMAACLAGLASWQNSPLGALVILIVLVALLQRIAPARKLVTVIVAAATTAVPYVFFLVTLRTPSLLAKYAGAPQNITLTRVVELFVDPNIGILTYTPVILIACLGVVIRDLAVRRRLSLAVGLFTVVVLMGFVEELQPGSTMIQTAEFK